MHGNITGPVSAEESSVELPSQLIGIELCSTSASSAYTREQWPTLQPCGPFQVWPISPSGRARTLQPLHEKPSTARCTAIVSTVAVTAAGTTTLLVDARRTCRRPRALLHGHASKSGQTRPRTARLHEPRDNVAVPSVHKKHGVIGFPLLSLHRRLIICYNLA